MYFSLQIVYRGGGTLFYYFLALVRIGTNRHYVLILLFSLSCQAEFLIEYTKKLNRLNPLLATVLKEKRMTTQNNILKRIRDIKLQT